MSSPINSASRQIASKERITPWGSWWVSAAPNAWFKPKSCSVNIPVLLLFFSTWYFDFWKKKLWIYSFLKYLEHFFALHYFKAMLTGGIKAHASYIFSVACNFYQCKISLYFIGLALGSILPEVLWNVIVHSHFHIVCNFFTYIYF